MAKQAATSATPKKTGGKTRRRATRMVPSGIAFVKATFNNTIVTITDPSGGVVGWSSAGKMNFSGSRKSSAFAAQVAAADAAKAAMSQGMKEVEVYVKGPGAGRESAVRALQSAGLAVTKVGDSTPVPHNGCRPPKRRRV